MSFGALARRVVDGVAARALENDIDLGLDERDPASATVKVETTMGEMLLNLVDNAPRYCSVGCSVTVMIEMEGQEAVLTVQDDGPGLPPVEEERVFERFYRVEGTAPSARGLGLSIVKEMAEAAGGRVAALRSASGGLRVVVGLPASVDGLAGPALG